MQSTWHIDEFVKDFTENQLEDSLEVIGAQCVKWASENLKKGYSKNSNIRSGNLNNSLCFSTSKIQSPVKSGSGQELDKPEKGTVRIGSNVIYARIHEFGGRITANNAGALTIPISEEAKKASSQGKSARDFMDLVLIHPKESDNVFLVRMTGKDTFIIMYMLVKSVDQPARPYLRLILENHKQDIIKILGMVKK
jgi:phage gpG-like protein